jgi:hypothetical protein
MKRKQSNNPNRTEENKDLFDYMEGQFSVWSGHHFIVAYKYIGNNIQESLENRNKALHHAKSYVDIMKPFQPNITFIEEDL